MATFTLAGNIQDLSGQSSRVSVADIQTLPGPVAEPGGSTFTDTRTPVTEGVLEVELPQDAEPTGYVFRVTFPQVGLWWELSPPDDPDVTVWLSDYPSGVPIT